MSMMKRQLEDLAYKYLESHPELDVEDVMEKIVYGTLHIEEGMNE